MHVNSILTIFLPSLSNTYNIYTLYRVSQENTDDIDESSNIRQ